MKLKVIIAILTLSALLQLLISPLRGYVNINASTVVGYISYLLYTGICIHYFSKKVTGGTIILCVIAGICLLQLPLRVMSFKSTLFTLPDMLSHIAGVFSAYFYFKFEDVKRWVLPCVLSLAIFFMVTKGYTMWSNILDNNTLNGKVNETTQMDYQGINNDGRIIKGIDLNTKIVLLDFWFIGCKPCYVGFPELQRIYNKFKDSTAIKIFAVNLPQTADRPNDAFEFLKQKGYRFPNLVLESKEKSAEFGVKACPTTILLDKNRRIVFRGSLSDAEKVIEETLNKR